MKSLKFKLALLQLGFQLRHFYDKFVNKLNREFTIDFETTNKYVDAICDFNLKPWDNIKLRDNIPQEQDQASVMRGGGIVCYTATVSPTLLLESKSEWLGSWCHDDAHQSPWWRVVALTKLVTPSAAASRDQGADICPLTPATTWLTHNDGHLFFIQSQMAN